MEFKCMYCDGFIGVDAKGKEEGVSHGICPDCWPFLKAEMEVYKLTGMHGHLMNGGKRERTKEALHYII